MIPGQLGYFGLQYYKYPLIFCFSVIVPAGYSLSHIRLTLRTTASLIAGIKKTLGLNIVSFIHFKYGTRGGLYDDLFGNGYVLQKEKHVDMLGR